VDSGYFGISVLSLDDFSEKHFKTVINFEVSRYLYWRSVNKKGVQAVEDSRAISSKMNEENEIMLPVYVVLVDSDPRFLEIATRFLQKRDGALVYSAVTTSDEILQQASVFEPDVVLYNLGDSDPKSLETIRQLRNKFPAMTIIVVSPPENEYFKQAVLEAGASDVMLRQLMTLEFLPALWSLISMYQHRFGRSRIGTIPGNNNFFGATLPSSNTLKQQTLTH